MLWSKRLPSIIQTYLEKIEQLETENCTLREAVDALEGKYKILQRKYKALSRMDEFEYYNELVRSYENVHGKTMVVGVDIEADNEGKLRRLHFQLHDMDDPRSPARWHTHIDCDVFYDKKRKYIRQLRIQECQTREPNQGYGSLLMESFLDYVRRLLEVRQVLLIGKLSLVDEEDEENHQRRNHFYQKFGFVIKEGYVYKTLNCSKNKNQ